MALRMRGMEKMMMMAPSTGYHGGGGSMEQAAFVAAASSVNNHHTLRRCSTSLSSSSTAATSSSLYNEGDNNRSNSGLLFTSRGGHQQTQMQQQRHHRVPRIDEPNLYDIPPNIHPTYRPIPLILRMIINVSSAILIARIKSWKHLISILKNVYHHLPSSLSFTQALTTTSTSNNNIINYMTLLKNVISILLRYFIVSTLFKVTIQEVAYRPSRVTMEYLVENDLLPSTLSCYQDVDVERFDDVVDDDAAAAAGGESGNGDASDKEATQKTKRMNHQIGVHSLQYVNPNKYDDTSSSVTSKKANKEHDTNIDAISLHHGFGASSLSWLPILPSLVQQLDARVGVAHDSVGFGFTDRPHHDDDDDSHLEKYSSEMNVGIGFELLKSVHKEVEDGVPGVEKDEKAEEEKNGKKRSNIAIFGHSMGAKAALQMALACSKRNGSDDDVEFNPSLVVLVAPALEGVALPSSSRGKMLVSGKSSRKSSPGSISNKLSQVGSSIWVTCRKIFFHHPFRFGLRRLVGGTPNFWRKGLASAWGDPKRLSESDVLRFQWPSIGMGWEQGLLDLVRHKLSSSSASSSASLNDEQLLHRVSNMKNTKVVIIYGSKDRIVRFEGAVAEKVKQEFPNVHLVRMEGGHDPFEEDVDGFLNELKAVC